jgi:hypothetical protein
MANTASFSRGDSFGCTWTWSPGVGEPANLLGTTITSDIQDRCGNLYALTVTVAGDGLSFTTVYTGDTSEWAVGQANWDIRFVFDGSPTTHSQQFRVVIADTVTKA